MFKGTRGGSSSDVRFFSTSVHSSPSHLPRSMRADRPVHNTSDTANNNELLEDIGRIRTAQGTYPDAILHTDVVGAVQGALHSASRSAQESLGWLRHALEDPADVASAAVGRMVSKEYGKHEPPHTEHHMWQQRTSPHASSPLSPMGSSAHPMAGSSSSTAPPPGQQHQGQHGDVRGPAAAGLEGVRGSSSSHDGGHSSPGYVCPYSGPGFLLHRDPAKADKVDG